MTASRLVIWRHGRTEWNLTRRFQGQSDVPLDSTGVAQAAAVAPVLSAEYRPEAIVSSDLLRTKQTAEPLSEVTGLPVDYDPDLREVDVGSWSGLYVHEVKEKYADAYAPIAAGSADARRGGDGETLRELADRVEKGFLRAIDSVSDGATVAVVCHGLATKVGVAQLIGLPVEHWEVFGSLLNCAWVVIEPGGHGWRMTGWNLHVPGDEPQPGMSH